MAQFRVPNIEIKGISACVPSTIERTEDIPFYTAEEAQAIIESTGVKEKRVAASDITASDLCCKSAEILLKELNWESKSIDIICFVTQTPDFLNHPNGFVVHEKLGLSEDCIVLDLFHGCPGWIMGLSTISSIMSHGKFKRGLLLAGDVLTAINYKLCRESRPLFGDAGTATALEYIKDTEGFVFDMGTNSKEGGSLIRKRGRAREPFTPDTFKMDYEMLKGIRSTDDADDVMDGMSVFSFGISKPPKSIKNLLEAQTIDLKNVDKVLIHQANKLMVEKIIKKLKIEKEKAPIGLTNYGNTASASIPLAIVTECREDYQSKEIKTVCCGFGTGLSWASSYFATNKIVCPPIIEY